MRKSTLTVVAIIVIALIAGGVFLLTNKSDNNSTTNTSPSSSNSNSGSSSSSQASATGAIDIKNMMFTPSQITVKKGGTVTWTNNDTMAHTVVADLNNGPASGTIAPGGTYSYTFEKTGSFQYHCSIHPSMRGTIVVK